MIFAYTYIAGRDTLYTRVIELAFKRHVMSSSTRAAFGWPFYIGEKVNIYIYSDESGVFDKNHNDIFVFGGLIILGKESKEEWSRRYSAAEKIIRQSKRVGKDYELKATQVLNSEKGKLFRSLNNCHKFGVVIDQKRVLNRIYEGKKDKQRYLDYAYKIAVKRAFEKMIHEKKFNPQEIERLYFYVDEHTTATNGCYELKEALEQEFKNGTYNYRYDTFFPPIFPYLGEVHLEFCNSKSKLLVRAADIVANRIFYLTTHSMYHCIEEIQNFNVSKLP